MTLENLQEIFNKIKNVRAGIIGDFCVDIYWHADMKKSDLSKETPHFPLPIINEFYAPGAAGNVAANMMALQPASLQCLGLCGMDWRGDLLEQALRQKGVETSLLACPDRITNAYCKPLRHGISDTVYEDPRLDFENHTQLSEKTEEFVLAKLEQLAPTLDVLAVSDQFCHGLITPRIREKLIVLSENGLKMIADSRHNIGQFRNMFLKPNESECAFAVGAKSPGAYEQNARELALRNHATVIETLGEKGALITDGSYTKQIPAVKLTGALDICGAGDTSLAALTLAVGAGFNLLMCAEFAALASAVTVKKIGETGTASPEEISAVFCAQAACR